MRMFKHMYKRNKEIIIFARAELQDHSSGHDFAFSTNDSISKNRQTTLDWWDVF